MEPQFQYEYYDCFPMRVFFLIFDTDVGFNIFENLRMSNVHELNTCVAVTALQSTFSRDW